MARRAAVHPTTVYRRWGTKGRLVGEVEEVRSIIARAVERSEFPTDTDPLVLVDLIVRPTLVRALFMGRNLSPAEGELIVARALAAVQEP